MKHRLTIRFDFVGEVEHSWTKEFAREFVVRAGQFFNSIPGFQVCTDVEITAELVRLHDPPTAD